MGDESRKVTTLCKGDWKWALSKSMVENSYHSFVGLTKIHSHANFAWFLLHDNNGRDPRWSINFLNHTSLQMMQFSLTAPLTDRGKRHSFGRTGGTVSDTFTLCMNPFIHPKAVADVGQEVIPLEGSGAVDMTGVQSIAASGWTENHWKHRWKPLMRSMPSKAVWNITMKGVLNSLSFLSTVAGKQPMRGIGARGNITYFTLEVAGVLLCFS